MQPCENKNEFYNFRVVVYPNSTIKYVKDETEPQNGKCARELSQKVSEFMKKWNPPVIDGQKVAAITSYYIYPDDLFENYTPGYDPIELVTLPEFKGGLNGFSQKVANRIDLSKFRGDGIYRFVVKFVVNEEGKMEDIYIENPDKNEDVNYHIISAVTSIKTLWKPATFRNHPVKYRFILPLTFNYR